MEDPEVKKIHAKKMMELRRANPEKYKEISRRFRQTDKYKKAAKRAEEKRKTNPKRIMWEKKYHANGVENLTDSYIKNVIAANGVMKYKDVPDEVIQERRELLLIKRAINSIGEVLVHEAKE